MVRSIEFFVLGFGFMGVGQMTMFDHDGGRGVKNSENLTTWYMDAPKSDKEDL